jgi:predicted unusual protein kinase regulating ubiquinone biosynthesis (AarF/ABC1/UbiB family)
MALSLNPEHLKRYARIARLLARYGRSDFVRQAGLHETLEEDNGADDGPAKRAGATPEADELAADLEQMGATYIKLGQLLSTRVDLLPLAYTDALTRLQDSVEPFPFSDVQRIIEEELGVKTSRAFLELDPEPLAAASLGQVHRAKLRDGRSVAVKVQRPGVRDEVIADLAALEELAEFADRNTELGRRYEFAPMLAEMKRTLLGELDYRQEATNLATLGANLAEFRRIVVPRPVDGYTTARVLTMEFVRGRKITAVSPLARIELDGDELADELFRAYLTQILVDGFFHADPHPGNVFITDDNRIALIDVGMVGRITPDLQDELMRLLLSISEGEGEEVANRMVRMGERLDDFDEGTFRSYVTDLVVRYQDVTAEQAQIGRVMLEVTRAGAEHGLRVPPQLTLLGKTLLNLDQVGRTLDAEFQPNAAVRRHAAELMRRRMLKSASPAHMFSSILELNEFVQRLPARLNRMLDAVADREVEVRVRVMNETVMMEGLQKVANRIATGLVLAALIVGAAMMMTVETSVRILGYPALAMVCFIAAMIGGIALLISIFLHDRRSGGKRRSG